MDTKIRKRTSYTIGEFSVEGTPCDGAEPQITLSEDGQLALVGYIVHEEGADNPLEYCDGLGTIHHHPRSNYGRRDTGDYCAAVGLDPYGQPDLDLVDDAPLRDKYIAYFIALTSAEECEAEWNRDEGEDDDEVFIAACAAHDFDHAWPKQYDDYLTELRLEAWAAARAAGKIGDADAVLLDRYEHGLCSYSVHSGRSDWDLSSGEAVWVPDTSACREELQRRAAVYAFGRIVNPEGRETRWWATFDPAFREDAEFFDEWGKAFEWLRKVAEAEGWQASPEQFLSARQRAAEELAERACDLYTAWANGECYCVTLELHELKGSEWLLKEQVCGIGTYYGSGDAESALTENMAEYAAVLKPD